jgi:AmiR/NasT family two-component response regulator
MADEESLAASRAAAVTLAHNHEAYERLATKADQLQHALTSRIEIEQAKGIIMAERRCSPTEAFEILRQTSRSSNVKLHDLAAVLVAKAGQRADSNG